MRRCGESSPAALLQRLLLTPVATNARVSVGMATPYASMLLEAREGEVAAIPLDAVPGRAQAHRRRPAALLCGQPQPLHGPRAARAAHRPDRPEQVAERRPRPTRKSRLITTPTRPTMRPRTPATSARPWCRTRRPRTPSPRGPKAARRSPPRPPGGRQRGGDLAQGPEPRGLFGGRRRQGRGGRVRRAVRRGRRPDPVRLRLGRRQGRFGQDGRRQIARPGARAKSPPSSPPTSARTRSRTSSTRSRTRSMTAAISPKRRRRRSFRSRPRR